MRLFPVVARRLEAIVPDEPLLPRLTGVGRFIWAKRQRLLADATPYLKALAGAGIVPLVTKGTARVALDPGSMSERHSADIDLVIPPERWEQAVDLLIGLGFNPSDAWPRDRIVQRMREIRHAIAFARGEAEIDLHLSASHMNRCLGDDDRMRGRAVTRSLCGVPVLLPAASDRLMMALIHGLYYDPTRPAEWALDAAAAMREADFDWRVAEDEIVARGVAAPTSAGLAYLADELGQPVPSDVRKRLEADAGPHFIEELESVFRSHQPATPYAATARYMAEVERAYRAAARMPPGEPPPPPSPEWQTPRQSERGYAVLSVPPNVSPAQSLGLELRLPAARFLARRRITYELQCNFEIRRLIREWRERPARRLDERVVAIDMPGAFLALREIRELQFRAWYDDRLGIRRWVDFDGLAYRWAERA